MNGYTSIQIGGETVGIKFGFPAIREFRLAAEKKKDIYYAGDDDLTWLGMAKLIQCGYKNNCEIKEVEPVLTLEDFNNWTEEAMVSDERKADLAVVLMAFAESQYVKYLAEIKGEAKEEGKKKNSKATMKKSKASY